MEQYANVVQDLQGNVVPQAVVRVLLPNGGNALVYDINGAPMSNPVPCDAEGGFQFQAANGKYFAQVEVGGQVYKKLGPIQLYDPADDDVKNRVSILKFMSTAQIQDCQMTNPLLDHTDALLSMLESLVPGKREGYIPDFTFNFSTGAHVRAGTSLEISPSAKINYTGNSGNIFQAHIGATLLGGRATVTIKSLTWADAVVLVDGSERIRGDAPVTVQGFSVIGADGSKGTCLKLKATGAGHSVAFCSFRDFTSSNIKETIELECGNGGLQADPATWHWINSNIFENFVSFSATHLLTVNGTASVPGEVAANKFNNLQYQTTDTPNGAPVRVSGASQNIFIGLQIWDWNIPSLGSPIVFENGAQFNNVYTNIDATQVAGASNNKVYDLTGSETGQKIFVGPVAFQGLSAFGKAGQNGQYGGTYWPDVPGSAINYKNDGTGLSFATGANPYGSRGLIAVLSELGHLLVYPRPSANPSINGEMVFEKTSDTILKVKVKGSDGIVRSVSLTLT